MTNFKAGLMLCSLLCATAAFSICVAAEHTAAEHAATDPADAKTPSSEELSESSRLLHDAHQTTQGSITVQGRAIAYQAEAGRDGDSRQGPHGR